MILFFKIPQIVHNLVHLIIYIVRLAPVDNITRRAIRLWSSQYSNAKATRSPPTNTMMESFKYSRVISSANLQELNKKNLNLYKFPTCICNSEKRIQNYWKKSSDRYRYCLCHPINCQYYNAIRTCCCLDANINILFPISIKFL